MTAIDAEIEPSRKYLEYLQPSTGHWVSIIYEIADILQAIGALIYLFYKKSRSYVASTIDDYNLRLKRPQNLTEWKPIIIGAVTAGAIVLLIWTLKEVIICKIISSHVEKAYNFA